MNHSLPRSTLLAYAMPALPLAVPTVAVYILLPTFYVEELGLSLALTGLMLMLARLSDVLTDPLIGRWLDKASPRRYQSSMVVGGLLCLPGLWILIHPVESAAIWSLLFGSMLLYLGWTLLQIPYISWLSHLSRSSHQRSRAASYREGMAILGLLISASVPLLLLLGLSTQQMLQLMALFTLFLGAVLLYRMLSRLPPPQRQPQPCGPWRAVLNNKPALRLLLAWLINGIANGIPAVLFPLYITSVLGLASELRALYILLYFLAAFAALPLWLWLSQRYDKLQLWRVAMLLATIGFLPAALLQPGDGEWFVLVCLLTGMALGADLALPHVIQSELTDWDRYRYRQQQAGLLFAFWNGASKLAMALAAMIALGLLGMSGFDAAQESMAAPIETLLGPVFVLALIYALLPCVLKLTAIATLWRFPLKSRHHPAIIRALSRRESRSATHATPTLSAPLAAAPRSVGL
ncbi:MAG: MFS transporter [Chromatiales bacterium]|nr:MFS transporter [Gammaproteobacteria bacterium]MBW6475541.1 MFS transporter [Chromatiales bacterium]